MDTQLIALAVPLFLISMAIEFLANRAYLKRHPQPKRLGIGAYRFSDTFSNLACGIGNQLLDPLFKVISIWAYMQCYEYHIFQLNPVIAWIIAFIGVDFMYYWFHRASHRINFLWATHAVHHQSEEYNLAVALRQPWFEKLFDIPFYLPLAFLGVPISAFLTAFTLNLIYQFYLHATFVPKLGPLEKLLNTPSHHRVHHGIDPEYIDKNYGGIFIIWDRLFGSFIEESTPVHYGTVKALGSFNPLWANVVQWSQLLDEAIKTPVWAHKIWIFFAPPEWRPTAQGGPLQVPPVAADRRLFEVPISRAKQIMAALVLLTATACLQYFLEAQTGMSLPQIGLWLLIIVGLISSVGRWLSHK